MDNNETLDLFYLLLNKGKWYSRFDRHIFKRKLIKEEITYRNMIINMLCDSSKLYPTKREMLIATEDLITLPTPTRTGYEFNGWYKSDISKKQNERNNS